MQRNFHMLWTSGIVAFVLGKHEPTQDMSNLVFVQKLNTVLCDIGVSPDDSIGSVGDKAEFCSVDYHVPRCTHIQCGFSRSSANAVRFGKNLVFWKKR